MRFFARQPFSRTFYRQRTISVFLTWSSRTQLAGTTAAIVALTLFAQASPIPRDIVVDERNSYQIKLTIDFDALSYTGSQRVRWINRSQSPTSAIYFHLYSNLRPDGPAPTAAKADEEPRIEVTGVRSATDETPITYSIEDQGVTLRVNLGNAVPPGEATEVILGFKGTVPEVDADETGLTSHVVKQVSAALRGERELRRPRDVNFRCKGVMLLGTPHPVLAVRNDQEWMRRVDPSVGDFIFNEVADYDIAIETGADVNVFTSAATQTNSAGAGERRFTGTALRDFAVIAGRALRSEEVQVGDTTLRSIFLPEHERIGKRVLTLAANAVKSFTSRFGAQPYKTINIAEAPLVAGLGSTEFSGLEIIASAYYVDFDSPAIRNLPEIIREQRPSVEESLEWSVAHLTAHQWWGAAVGNDPARVPVLDEAMSSWSALLYFRDTYGEQKAAAILEDQLRGVYRVYRTFGGSDMSANRPARDYRNTFQYAAVVTTKGALMFVQLQRLLGEDTLLKSIREYYKSKMLQIADLDDLRDSLVSEAPAEKKRAVNRTFQRWLMNRHGDEDIAKPDQELASSLGIPGSDQKRDGRNPLGAFGRVGKFFWQQMTRIR